MVSMATDAAKALNRIAGGVQQDRPLAVFIQLNDFKGLRPGDPAPLPKSWLAECWTQQNPDLPNLITLMKQSRITLLLDALNEMPQLNTEVIQLWKDFLSELNADVFITQFQITIGFILISCTANGIFLKSDNRIEPAWLLLPC